MRKTGRIGFLPFPPDMHASMMPKLSPQDVAFSNASLSTLRSPDTPGKRPLSLVSIVQTLLVCSKLAYQLACRCSLRIFMPAHDVS